ncbi:hypothetical protein LBMAG53_19960 [Planctomycetota bacterium]|nr:hypothetical protein LBMAG53_19960 [Planctomycetota bacterium]
MSGAVPALKATETFPNDAWEDDLLLCAIADAPLGPAERQIAEAAFRVFMDRWGKPMERMVTLWCRYPPASYVGIDPILSDLWMKVLNGAKGFSSDCLSGDLLQRRTAAWLRTIARNACHDLTKAYTSRKLCEIPDEGLEAPPSIDPELVGGNPRLAILADCLRRLTEREQDVLRASADFIDAKNHADALPSHVREHLCKRYGTTRTYLRQIRKRAMEKLEICAGPKIAALKEANHAGHD